MKFEFKYVSNSGLEISYAVTDELEAGLIDLFLIFERFLQSCTYSQSCINDAIKELAELNEISITPS